VPVEVIHVPKRIIEEARRRGVDVEEVVLKALASAINADDRTVIAARLELAEEMLSEAREYIARGDVVQASEKLYKAVEECIKALAEALKAPQLEEVERRGKWDTWLLGMAATDLSRLLKEDRVRFAWTVAYDVHVWGFHEAKYRVEDVEAALPLAEWLLSYVKKTTR